MKIKILLLFTLVFSLSLCQEKREQVSSVWPEVTSEMKPWTRWWWMGNGINKPEIGRQLENLAKAGFGGVEITPIYGVKGFEDQYVDFLSDEWMDILDFTITKADELGMGVDMNLGTGWPFGGPQITPEFAASRLILQKYQLKSGEKLQEKIQIDDPKQNPEDVPLLALMAYYPDGHAENISGKVEENQLLNWSPDQDVEIVAAFNGKTRQQVKRAAPGGEGFSMDHFSKEALEVYLSRFDSAFSKIDHRPRSFFNDSFEAYGSSSTETVFEEFQRRKGYDLRNYLRELDSEEDIENVRRVKSDYREVISDLLRENFTLPWKAWSNDQGALTRNQAHGSPGNIIDLYGTVDIPECETFGSSYFPIPGLRRDSADIRDVDPDPIMMKFATSAANVLGKDYASSETFTWLAEHFKVSLSQCKPELEQVWLAGVNHVFYHGTTYSPEVAGWPGWLFYASVQFGPVNSFWTHINGLNAYIARTQSILQGGNADNDVLVYWPIYDVWNDAGRLDMQISIHNIDEWLHPTSFYKLSEELMDEGFLIDFATDDMIIKMFLEQNMIQANTQGGKYKTLIIPACELLPIETLNNVVKLAEQGATIIFEELPKDVPGIYNLEERRSAFEKILSSINFENGKASVGAGKIFLSTEVEKTLGELSMEGEPLVNEGLKFVRRVIDGEQYYYIVNHTPETVDKEISFNTITQAVILMDPDHGDFGFVTPKKQGDKNLVRIQLESGQSIILRATEMDVSQIPEWNYTANKLESIPLDGPWKLSFIQGGPELPVGGQLDQLTSWTNLEDEKTIYFSGTAAYEYSMEVEPEPGKEYILDLGTVAESAKVLVNDQEVGVLWSLPFKVRIGKYLQSGENTIRIEVANLMANRIRNMDQQGIEWRKFHEINFVNIDYKPFDASAWEPMPSGLLGPVVLEAVDIEKY